MPRPSFRRMLLLCVCVGSLATLLPPAPRAEGTFEVLHDFSGGAGNGAVALGALMQAPDGNLYGTTQRGGAFGLGTVYRYAPGGGVTIIHHFSGTDGALPVGGLVMGVD